MRNTSGTAAASSSESDAGTGIAEPASTTTSSAYPPPASSAIARSPGRQPSTPSPTSITVPAHSSPRIGEAPSGGG